MHYEFHTLQNLSFKISFLNHLRRLGDLDLDLLSLPNKVMELVNSERLRCRNLALSPELLIVMLMIVSHKHKHTLNFTDWRHT